MVLIEGKVCGEIEARKSTKGLVITTFKMENSSGYMDKNGEWRSNPTQVVEITLFGARGEGAASNICYDDHIIVEGKVSCREYNGKYYTQIIANNIMPRGHSNRQPNRKVEPDNRQPVPETSTTVPTTGTPPEDDTDLPF